MRTWYNYPTVFAIGRVAITAIGCLNLSRHFVHPLPIHISQQSLELEGLVIRDFGISGYELMQRAGRGAFKKFQEYWPQFRKIAVVCGSGNNGGDGYAFASTALDAGYEVEVRYNNEPKTSEALKARKAFSDRGGKLEANQFGRDCSKFDVVIDALLGIGLNRKITGQMADAINIINHTAKRVMSLDIPSGVDSDSGGLAGHAIKAATTVTFISPKVGLLCLPASEYVGRLFIDTLDVPPEAYTRVGHVAHLVSPAEFTESIPRRKDYAYKSVVGQVLIIGGSESMEGAAVMAAQAAYRAGAGLVSIATISENPSFHSHQTPEIRVHKVVDDHQLEKLIEDHDVIGIGPGLGQSDEARSVFDIVCRSGKKFVVDADGLNILATTDLKNDHWILTPHLGEAARLLHTRTIQIQNDRLETASKIAERYGGVCVLKGQNTVIASKEGSWICNRGNSGMATAGMGDILTGVISGIWAPAMHMESAACAGVWLHAVAGDESAAEYGKVGLMATDLLPGIRKNLNRVLDGSAVCW